MHARICICCTTQQLILLSCSLSSTSSISSMLDKSPWGIQGVQVWAVHHPVARTALGEVSTCAQLRAMRALGDGKFKRISGILSSV